MLSAIASGNAPRALGPYSQAIRAGQFLFLSGQIPIDPTTGELAASDIGGQARRVLLNVGEVLAAAGASFQQVVKTTVFLTDLNDFPGLNEVYATFFTVPQPARTTVQVARLPKDARLEIDVIAFLG
jgi:2-iminobutanoate/2-iminopropanoate deaminase